MLFEKEDREGVVVELVLVDAVRQFLEVVVVEVAAFLAQRFWSSDYVLIASLDLVSVAVCLGCWSGLGLNSPLLKPLRDANRFGLHQDVREQQDEGHPMACYLENYHPYPCPTRFQRFETARENPTLQLVCRFFSYETVIAPFELGGTCSAASIGEREIEDEMCLAHSGQMGEEGLVQEGAPHRQASFEEELWRVSDALPRAFV